MDENKKMPRQPRKVQPDLRLQRTVARNIFVRMMDIYWGRSDPMGDLADDVMCSKPTVERVIWSVTKEKEYETQNLTLDYVSAFAKAFELKPYQLLQPSLHSKAKFESSLSKWRAKYTK